MVCCTHFLYINNSWKIDHASSSGVLLIYNIYEWIIAWNVKYISTDMHLPLEKRTAYTFILQSWCVKLLFKFLCFLYTRGHCKWRNVVVLFWDFLMISFHVSSVCCLDYCEKTRFPSFSYLALIDIKSHPHII